MSVTLLMLHEAQLTVLKLHQKAHKVLGSLTYAGPYQIYGIGVGAGIGGFTFLVISYQSVFITLLKFSQGADSVPDSAFAGAYLSVKVHGDRTVFLSDRDRTFADIQTVIEHYHVIIGACRYGLINLLSLGGRRLILTEISLKHKGHGIHVEHIGIIACQLIIRLGIVQLDAVVPVVIPYGQHAVGYILVPALIRHGKLQGRSRIIHLAGIRIVKDQLIITHGQSAGDIFIQLDGYGIILIIYHKIVGRDIKVCILLFLSVYGIRKCAAVPSHHFEIIGTLIREHGEIISRQIDVSGLLIIYLLRSETHELDLRQLTLNTRYEHIALTLTHKIFTHQRIRLHGGVAAHVVNLI